MSDTWPNRRAELGGPAARTQARPYRRDLNVDLVDAMRYRLENGALRRDMINGKLDVYDNDGTSEGFPDLEGDDLYPAHAPSRMLADLVLGDGENLAPKGRAAWTVEFLEAAYASAASGQRVRIDELR